MSAIANAQARVIDDARVAWQEAIAALDEAQRQAEILHEAHLMHDDDFWQALSALGGMTTLLTELIDVLDELDDP